MVSRLVLVSCYRL